MKQLFLIETTCTAPCRNLALEKYLMDHVQPGQCILYLWQNANTVVIGRNQCAADECRIPELEAAGAEYRVWVMLFSDESMENLVSRSNRTVK